MRLTKFDKEAFVRAVLDDVPQIDYNEQARKVAMADVIARLPQKIQDIWKDNNLRGFISCQRWLNMPGRLHGLTTPYADGEQAPETEAQLKELAGLYDAQCDSLRKLETNLEGAIGACSTLKKAKEVLPEFEKYLPADRDGTGVSGLPAIANLVSDLMQAGWPKGATA